MIHAAVWRNSTLGLEVEATILGYHWRARMSPRNKRSPICTNACCALRGLEEALSRYSVISPSESLRPNHVPYQNRKGNSTRSNANPVTRKYTRRPGRREGVVGG